MQSNQPKWWVGCQFPRRWNNAGALLIQVFWQGAEKSVTYDDMSQSAVDPPLQIFCQL